MTVASAGPYANNLGVRKVNRTGAGFVTQTNSVKELKEKALTTVTGWHRSTSCTIALLVEGALL